MIKLYHMIRWCLILFPCLPLTLIIPSSTTWPLLHLHVFLPTSSKNHLDFTLQTSTTSVSLSLMPPLPLSHARHHHHQMDFDLYDLLGIDNSCDQSQVKVAYRSLQKRCHPDIAGPAGHDMAIILNEAYSILSDPNARLAYDKVIFNLIFLLSFFCFNSLKFYAFLLVNIPIETTHYSSHVMMWLPNANSSFVFLYDCWFVLPNSSFRISLDQLLMRAV